MQKKLEIFKKRIFLGQALDFLPPRKTGLYISRVEFFFFEYHEFSIKDLIKYKQIWPPTKTIPIKTESKIDASEVKG